MSENPIAEVDDKPDVTMHISHTPVDKLTPPEEGVRDISPVIFFDRLDPFEEEAQYDFRPVERDADAEEEDEVEQDVAPKDLSVQESVDSSGSQQTSEPPKQETTASAAKDSGQPKASESSTPSS